MTRNAYALSMKHAYVTYMVRCSDGSYYTGITNNLRRRLYEHNHGGKESSYTYGRRPVQLVYAFHFLYVLDAIAWEKHLKCWSRAKKEALINYQRKALFKAAWNQYRKRIAWTRRNTRNCMTGLLRHPSPELGLTL